MLRIGDPERAFEGKNAVNLSGFFWRAWPGRTSELDPRVQGACEVVAVVVSIAVVLVVVVNCLHDIVCVMDEHNQRASARKGQLSCKHESDAVWRAFGGTVGYSYVVFPTTNEFAGERCWQ